MRILAYFLIVSLFAACLKKNTDCPYTTGSAIASTSEEQALQSYLTSNNINALRHASGMYYEILMPGNGSSPHLCSQVSVNYSGKLTNGNVFDQQTNSVFVLGVLITGWKYGLPMIQKGGRIKLYIPPSLGYGHNDVKDMSGNVIIPGNSILIFDITLQDVL